MSSESKSFFRTLLEKYNELCKDLDVDQGACRGCVPIVKFDPEQDDKSGEKTKDV
ncbi:DUF5363 domain-containing protein [Glaesserella parasuis]|uniref:DUF5363 domain-containing protein n=1 Tax=Glaesserella parasuis TaxID=738 RepID=UPI000A65F4BE|nr:DUF5363 domain-containing protein [Glaesserella parasuis]